MACPLFLIANLDFSKPRFESAPVMSAIFYYNEVQDDGVCPMKQKIQKSAERGEWGI